MKMIEVTLTDGRQTSHINLDQVISLVTRSFGSYVETEVYFVNSKSLFILETSEEIISKMT